MVRKSVSFSNENLDIVIIDDYHQKIESAISLYYSNENPEFSILFNSYSSSEIQDACQSKIDEHEKLVIMNLFAAVEAMFRIDYLQRCYRKKKDVLSVAFRSIYKTKGKRVSLEDDIFIAWKDNTAYPSRLISDLKGAFRYRHWLAHGRYWEPKLGRKYDYFSVFTLVQTVFDSFPFEGP